MDFEELINMMCRYSHEHSDYRLTLHILDNAREPKRTDTLTAKDSHHLP